jgi:selT/selW/selH-like putative selenoprotein
VTLKSGRTSSFEITLDGDRIHSKLESEEWPDTEEILRAIAARLPA